MSRHETDADAQTRTAQDSAVEEAGTEYVEEGAVALLLVVGIVLLGAATWLAVYVVG